MTQNSHPTGSLWKDLKHYVHRLPSSKTNKGWAILDRRILVSRCAKLAGRETSQLDQRSVPRKNVLCD